jgi:hypothetical protein
MAFHVLPAGPSPGSGFAAPNRVAIGPPGRGAFSCARHRYGYGPSFYPLYFPSDYFTYDEAILYGRPYTELVEQRPEPAVISPPAQEPTPPKAHIIDIPASANSFPAKRLPPTVFILGSGERLETSQFLLTAAKLSINDDQRQRIISLDQLNLDATIAANRERGIDLRIPDQNEIWLRF